MKEKEVNLIVKYNIKRAIPRNMRVAGNVGGALNKRAQEILNKAVARVKANKRKTLMAQDV